MTALEKNIQTNFTLDKMTDIQHSYKKAVQHVKQIEIKGEDKKTKDLSKTLRRQLHLEP